MNMKGNGKGHFQLKQVIKQAVQNVVLPVCYAANRRKATDPTLVVFADAHHNERPAAMELLYQRLKKSGKYRRVKREEPLFNSQEARILGPAEVAAPME